MWKLECENSVCVSYENNVLKRSTFSLAEDYSISCKTANLLSFLEKLVTMVTENTEKNSKKGGDRKSVV